MNTETQVLKRRKYLIVTEADLKYHGYLKTIFEVDDPRISGESDVTPFNKFELHEVLFVMNQVFFKLKILNPIYIQIIERFVRLFMPKHINNQIKAQNWIILALDHCEL